MVFRFEFLQMRGLLFRLQTCMFYLKPPQETTSLRTAKALVSLCLCAGSHESLLVVYVRHMFLYETLIFASISTIFSCARSFSKSYTCILH